MLILYNKHFPFGNYCAINIFGVIFARSQYGKLSKRTRNHEFIHTLQQRELLFVPFYILYGVEWLILFIRYRNLGEAYRHISFEREAYANDYNLEYRYQRPHYNWRHFYSIRLHNR